MNTKRPINNHKKSPRRSHSTRERVRTFLGLFGQKEDVLILINPDPDSMASALAVRRLLWKHVHRTVITYIGEIQRLENLAMRELLRIPMVKIDDVIPENFVRRVLVDRHAQDCQALFLVVAMQLLENGYLLGAVHARGSPEVDEDHLPSILVRCHHRPSSKGRDMERSLCGHPA